MDDLPDIDSFSDIEKKEMMRTILRADAELLKLQQKMRADGRWKLVERDFREAQKRKKG